MSEPVVSASTVACDNKNCDCDSKDASTYTQQMMTEPHFMFLPVINFHFSAMRSAADAASSVAALSVFEHVNKCRCVGDTNVSRQCFGVRQTVTI